MAQIAKKTGKDTGRVKTVYDIVSCSAGVALSFIFFGFPNFVGIGWGTVVCALFNGYIIGGMGKLWDRIFVFKDGLKMRKYFE